MIMDPMSNFTKEDWEAIERQGQHEAEMSAINSLKQDVEKKLNEMALENALRYNVEGVIIEDFPEEYNEHGKVFVHRITDFIETNCELSIANKKNSLRHAVKMAKDYSSTSRMVDVADVLAIYDDLKPGFRDNFLSSRYYSDRTILYRFPEIINIIYGTRITKKTNCREQFAIHEEILNGLHEINKAKIERCSETDKQKIQYVLLALKNIKCIEISSHPELKLMVNGYKRGLDSSIEPERLLKVIRRG